jgi:hypothetical protein
MRSNLADVVDLPSGSNGVCDTGVISVHSNVETTRFYCIDPHGVLAGLARMTSKMRMSLICERKC